jgi:TubC N-terminal docking domain
MSATRFLAELWQRGVVLRLNSDRSRIVVPRRHLTPELRARLAEDQPGLLQLTGFADDYRALIRNAFAVLIDPGSSKPALDELAEDQARLTDELGPALAGSIRDHEARQWARETGLCPVCRDLERCEICDDDEAGAEG